MSAQEIIPMRGFHIPEVLEIEKASFGMPWSRDAFLEVVANPAALAYVIIFGGEVAGYVCAHQIGEEAEILKLAVRPDMRGKGMARALNARCIKDLREAGCKEAFLEVRRSNRAAIKLYEEIGFSVVGVRKSYYTSPVEDALVMKVFL